MYLVSENINDGYVKHHLLTLPDWISVVPTTEEHVQNEFIIGSTSSLFEKGDVQQYLAELELLSHTVVNFKVFVDFFKIINFAIANPLNNEIFNLKVKSLYLIFKAIPLLFFNTDTCRELAVLTPFFPSGHDVERVLINYRQKITRNIKILQNMIQQN
ncbi:unnamed protein product [Commensalibacter communis]|uniref:hypothetical protein n=1 Tax=Commensalibacter communis TaxID=2972786 RepID=UPI0022FFB5F2|nr:hypothetical protein [Commensalibacter communis]CAI3955744.1 unnamed protein product [Commensalibacter communis]CAI3956512.1 unnamed protein product [Commensalibacter communis]